MLSDPSPYDPYGFADRLEALDQDDPAFGAALRVMMWDAYTDAGHPLGAEEEAMLAWWGFGVGTTVQ